MEKAIHLMKTEDRPRERLQLLGPQALTDQELLAIVLGSGNGVLTVMSLAENLISHAASLTQLSQFSLERLCQIKGIGSAKATVILAACELGRRALLAEAPKIRIKTENDAIRHFRHCFQQADELKYLVVLLDREQNVLASCELQPPDKAPPDLQQILKVVSDAKAHAFGLLRVERKDEASYELIEAQWLDNLRAAAAMMRVKFYSRLIVPT